MLKLPSFPNAEKDLLDQYVLAFRKVLGHAEEIANKVGKPEVV